MFRVYGVLLVLLGACLVAAGWAIVRLAEYQIHNTETVVFVDGASPEFTRQSLQCSTGSRVPALDVTDYSYNVTQSQQPSGLYRYKTNLDALPPVDVHVLVNRGGSGRVVLRNTDKPVWLVLLSTQRAIWHVETRPGANLERIVTNERVSEIRFSSAIGASAESLVDLFLGEHTSTTQPPAIDILPHSNCFVRLTRFQDVADRTRHEPAIRSLRLLLGHPESSLQAADEPSYFDRPLFVPFDEPDISPSRLAEVLRRADPLSNRARPAENSPGAVEERQSELQRIANMARDESVVPKELATPTEFISLLEEYQRRDLLPPSLPRSAPGSRVLSVADWYSLADYRRAYRREVPTGQTPDACNGGRDRDFLIVEGGAGSNVVGCAWGNQMYFMRGGDDEIDDSWEDDIINAGPGNDIIDAGWGNDIVFFNYGWGEDQLRKTCTGAAYVPQNTARASTVRWSQDWSYKNFIVFGKDIRRDDIVAIGNKLVHRETGDSVTVSGNCFNLVFWPAD